MLGANIVSSSLTSEQAIETILNSLFDDKSFALTDCLNDHSICEVLTSLVRQCLIKLSDTGRTKSQANFPSLKRILLATNTTIKIRTGTGLAWKQLKE